MIGRWPDRTGSEAERASFCPFLGNRHMSRLDWLAHVGMSGTPRLMGDVCVGLELLGLK